MTFTALEVPLAKLSRRMHRPDSGLLLSLRPYRSKYSLETGMSAVTVSRPVGTLPCSTVKVVTLPGAVMVNLPERVW